MTEDDIIQEDQAKKLSSFIRKFLPDQCWKKITVATLPFDFGSTTSAYSVQDDESTVGVIVELNNQTEAFKLKYQYKNAKSNGDDNNNEDGQGLCPLSLFNSPIEDAIIAFVLSSKGWGPRMFGACSEGKIFEHFEGEPLTPEAACDANVIRELAAAFAKIHSISSEVPIVRDKMTELKRFLIQQSCQSHNFDKVSKLLSETLQDLDEDVVKELIEFDLESEVKWLLRTYQTVPVKNSFIRFCNNFANILIRDRNSSSTCSSPITPATPASMTSVSSGNIFCTAIQRRKKIIFTNNSFAMFAPRGIDIGGHFINRMINWSHEKNKINEEPFPPVDERGLFVREYLEECQELNPQSFNADGMDNEGQVLMEADLGALFYSLYFFTWILSRESYWDLDPSIVTLLPFFHEFYTRYKLFCKKKYTQWP